MTHPDADTLRRVAALVLRHRLDGRTFPASVHGTAYRYRRDAPECVRELAARIQFRGRNLSPEGVACVLRATARLMERRGEPFCPIEADHGRRLMTINFSD